MLTLIVVLLYAAVVVLDLLPFDKRPKMQNAVYCALLLISFVVLLLFSFGVEVPSPSGPIQSFVQALFKLE